MTGNGLSTTGRWLALPLAALAVLCATLIGGWPREQAIMAGILTLAATLWITEAVPLFVTSLLVVGAEVLLLVNPGHWPGLGFSTSSGPTFGTVLGAAMDPVLVLFFAGLVMARAAVKESVDQTMAAWLLRPFVGSRPRLLYGVMGVTALFSMWMSNTATTAFMLTLTLPLLAQVSPADPFRKALLLAVPLAANIGGLGTPIASPPNAIAIGYLRKAGEGISFLQWMVIAVPLVLVLLGALGWLLLKLFRSPEKAETIFSLPQPPLGHRARWIVGIFTVTVLLWLTEGLHGLPASVVALLPVLALLVGGLITRADINQLEWDILLLIAGGLALGYGLSVTQLDSRIVALLPTGGGGFGLLAVLVVATFVLSILLSNSAVANLLLPIGLAAAIGSPQLVPILMCIALASSLAMALPVSTPPNAMAYARAEFTAADMARAGLPIGMLGLILLMGAALLHSLW